MIRHIVLFKFRKDVSAAARQVAAKAFKEGIEALPAVIPDICSVKVGVNVNPAEEWDICLTSLFSCLGDVKAYGAHPAHKAVASELMRLVDERACVDFEE